MTASRGARIAFLVPEYPTEGATAVGGLGTYARRMAFALRQLGHEPEVFVTSDAEPRVLMLDGVRVERTPPRGFLPQVLYRALHRAASPLGVAPVLSAWSSAAGLARALSRRHAEKPFDMVQSSDYMCTGLLVPRLPGRPHIVRSSWAGDLFQGIDRIYPARTLWLINRLERRALSRGDAACAPSRFVAEYHRRRGIPVEVVRPPAVLEAGIAASVSGKPARYLIHFGTICQRKGSDTVAAALVLAWQEAPDLVLVFAGSEMRPGTIARYRKLWGDRTEQVRYVGIRSPEEIHALLKAAEAAVLPSVVDNLPNTVIESLLLGTPVIGSRGASIDELVVDEVSGLLVEIENPRALADAMVRVWRRDIQWTRGALPLSQTMEEMQPERAVTAMLELGARVGMRGVLA